MKLLAYCRDAALRDRVAASVPAGVVVEWLATPDAATSRDQAGDVRGLLLLTADWPDPEVQSLIAMFSPRPVVLIDLTDAGHWHNTELARGVRLANIDALEEQLYRLCSPQAFSPARTLALLSTRNDYDGALVAIYAAWSLKKRKAGRVMILDLGMPQADVAAYLDLSPDVGLLDLIDNHHQLERGWLNDRGIEAAPGIDVVGLPAQSGAGRLSAETLNATLDTLESLYDHLLFNLVGVQPSALLNLICVRCEQQWLLSDQKSLSLASALDLANHLFEQGVRPGGVNLLLAPYHRDVLPARETIEQKLPLPLRGALPWTPRVLTHVNAGTLVPPPAELVPLQQAVERALWLREPDSWWRKLTQRSA